MDRELDDLLHDLHTLPCSIPVLLLIQRRLAELTASASHAMESGAFLMQVVRNGLLQLHADDPRVTMGRLALCMGEEVLAWLMKRQARLRLATIMAENALARAGKQKLQ